MYLCKENNGDSFTELKIPWLPRQLQCEFDLVLDDGSIEHCYGQWWDTINSDMKDYVPINNIISFAYSSINKLKDSYVFYGGKVDKLWLDNLISEYNATNKDHLEYEYWEYKNLLKK